MPPNCFQEFLIYLNTTNPHFDVKILLPRLLIYGVIGPDDESEIKNQNTTAERARVLCLNILPLKSKDAHRSFVYILRANDYTGLADFLEPRLNNFWASLQHGQAPNHQIHPAPVPSSWQISAVHSEISNSPKQATVQGHPAVFPKQSAHCQPQNFASSLPQPSDHYTLSKHEKKFYDWEAHLLGNVPDTAGHLDIKVQHSAMPYDSRDNEYYDTFSKKNGLALLINNNKFDIPENNRTGSLVDFGNMNSLLENLGYDVTAKNDQTADEMFSEVNKFAKKFRGKPDYHSCVIVVMTHGEFGQFFGTDGEKLDQERFFKVITENEDLAGKPKIFIIQACRGSKLHFDVMARDDGAPGDKNEALNEIAAAEADAQKALISKIPIGADVCVLHSTTPGYFSWRNKQQGSWFIQAICEEFGGNAHQPWADLMTLAIRVTKRVGTQFNSQRKVEGADGKVMSRVCVQLPSTEFNMMKKFHFFPKQH